jgi:diguanylate cyclase (GGDEF)-like protein
MSETIRNETQVGIADLQKRLNSAGLKIIEQHENSRHRTINFAIGDTENQTDVTLSEEFLDDLPNTKEYQAMVDSYARVVAGRLKCGSPELFYCESGAGVQVSFQWPIHGVSHNNEPKAVLLANVTNKVDGKTANCAVEVGGGRVPAVLVQVVNDIRLAVDAGQIKFFEPTVHQDTYQPIEKTKQHVPKTRSQSDVERFVAGKVYTLGFIAVDDLSDVWAVDPWDAQYLGVTEKSLALAMRVLRANGLLQAGSGPEHVRPTDKLLAERSSQTREKAPLPNPQQKLSHDSPPAKNELLKELQRVIEQHPTLALIMLDVDNFKSVNDTKGHPAGDACLNKFIEAVETVVGQRGRVYRWGGDEFAICLPDFSTAEALTTAERIRSAVEQAKAGDDIEVTTSIGVCGSDRTESKSPEELFDFADKAMYQSKHSGKNRVTTWPLSSAGPKVFLEAKGKESPKLLDSVKKNGLEEIEPPDWALSSDDGELKPYEVETVKRKLAITRLNALHPRLTIWMTNRSDFRVLVKSASLWYAQKRLNHGVPSDNMAFVDVRPRIENTAFIIVTDEDATLKLQGLGIVDRHLPTFQFSEEVDLEVRVEYDLQGLEYEHRETVRVRVHGNRQIESL